MSYMFSILLIYLWFNIYTKNTDGLVGTEILSTPTEQKCHS